MTKEQIEENAQVAASLSALIEDLKSGSLTLRRPRGTGSSTILFFTGFYLYTMTYYVVPKTIQEYVYQTMKPYITDMLEFNSMFNVLDVYPAPLKVVTLAQLTDIARVRPSEAKESVVLIDNSYSEFQANATIVTEFDSVKRIAKDYFAMYVHIENGE